MKAEFNFFKEGGEFDVAPVDIAGRNIAMVTNIFEAAAPNAAAIADFAGQQLRAAAMSCCLAWIEGGDYSYAAHEDCCVTMADADGDGEISDDEQDYLNELMQACADALVSMGADASNVQDFLDNESDDAGQKLGDFLSAKIADVSDDDDTIIANYAVGGDMVLESMVKVVRAGKVTLKRKRVGRPHKITSAQRAGLKKARQRAFTGAAKLHRLKSMNIRRKRGL